MQTRASTRSTVLGKRHADSNPKCDVATDEDTNQRYSPLTPEASPNPKRIKTIQCELDDGSNKENIPPLKGQFLSASPSRTRSLRRTNTEASLSSTRSTPRRYASMSSLSGNPRTPVTALSHPSLITPPSTPSSLQSVSAKARALLRPTSNNVSTIAGREKERDEIRSFILPFLQGSETADCRYPVLYISGSPGTGKTALVNEVLRTLTTELTGASAAIVPINCMALASVDALFTTLVERLQLQNGKSKTNKAGVNKDTSRQTLERLLCERNSKCLLFLDELDHIGSSTQALAELFSLIDTHSSLIRLIGIANTHTLTSSSSNTLSALSTEHVKTVHFQPYSSAQLLSILNTRLEPLFTSEVIAKSEDPKKFLPPTTLTLLSKKIASQTGDVRALFEVLRGAIDIAINAGSSALDAPTPPVTPAHVLEALKAYAPAAKVSRAIAQPDASVKVSDNETTMKIRNLGLQSRVVLLAILLASRRLRHGLTLSGTVSSPSTPRTPSKRANQASANSSTSMDVSQLHTYYSALLSRSDDGLFTPVSRSEFGDLMGVLETVGLVTLASRGGSKSPSSPSKSGRKLQRSMSSTLNVGSGRNQEVGLAESVRMEEVIKGLGINDEKKGGDGEEDVRAEEVKAIWKKEEAKTAKDAKTASKIASGADMFAEAIED